MTKKRDTNPITCSQQLEMTWVSKSIFKPQKVASTNFEPPKEQAEKSSISSRQECFIPHLAKGAYHSIYFLVVIFSLNRIISLAGRQAFAHCSELLLV